MAGTTITPTRMMLKQLKGRLKTARRGHKLMKDKRDELMRQFMDIVRLNKQLRERVEQGLADGGFRRLAGRKRDHEPRDARAGAFVSAPER